MIPRRQGQIKMMRARNFTKHIVAITVAVAGILVARPPAAAGAGSFASVGSSSGGSSMSHGGGGSSMSHGGGSSSMSHGGRSVGSTATRSSGTSSAARSSVARSNSSGYRFGSTTTGRGGNPFRNFSPGSVVPVVHGGFVASGSNGFGFAGQRGWNGRRSGFPFRNGFRHFGNGYLYFGPDYYGSDYEATPDQRQDAAYQAPDDAVAAPIAASATAVSPPPANFSPPVVSREFAYGSIVTEVQARLAGDGYFSGSVDGFINAGTRTAIAMFQDSHHLVITGRIDAALLQALGLKP
jgi:hypothetical protein